MNEVISNHRRAETVSDESLGGTTSNSADIERFRAMLQEYEFLYSDMQVLSQTRQNSNQFLIGSIDLVLLTGVAYAWLQYAQGKLALMYLFGGALLIAIFASVLNNAMLTFSEQQRRLMSLRTRYLESLERQMRQSGYFSETLVRLSPLEYPPEELLDNLVEEKDKPFGTRYLRVRGALTLGGVLHAPHALLPNAVPKRPVGFSSSQQIIARYFLMSFWVAALLPVALYAIQFVAAQVGLTFPLPH